MKRKVLSFLVVETRVLLPFGAALSSPAPERERNVVLWKVDLFLCVNRYLGNRVLRFLPHRLLIVQGGKPRHVQSRKFAPHREVKNEKRFGEKPAVRQWGKKGNSRSYESYYLSYIFILMLANFFGKLSLLSCHGLINSTYINRLIMLISYKPRFKEIARTITYTIVLPYYHYV